LFCFVLFCFVLFCFVLFCFWPLGFSFNFDLKGEITPMFLLFMDCIWQIYKDTPDAFEFNSRLLIFLADQSFCGRFGTFLGGLDREVVLSFTEPMKVASIYTRIKSY
jgi:hypothetical protein